MADSRKPEQIEAEIAQKRGALALMEEFAADVLQSSDESISKLYRSQLRSALQDAQALAVASDNPERPDSEKLLTVGGSKLYLAICTNDLIPAELRDSYFEATSAWYDAVPQSEKDKFNHELQLRLQ